MLSFRFGTTPEVRDSRTSCHSGHAQSQAWQIWLVLVSKLKSANMWVPWNIFLKAYVNKDNLHAFQSKIFLSRSLQMSHGLLWWDFSRFKRVDTTKTCVAVFMFSRRKISGLPRSLSVGTLICHTSLIKHLLRFVSSFTPLYISARGGKSRLWKRNTGKHSSSPDHRS